jgi:hypothetical protein
MSTYVLSPRTNMRQNRTMMFLVSNLQFLNSVAPSKPPNPGKTGDKEPEPPTSPFRKGRTTNILSRLVSMSVGTGLEVWFWAMGFCIFLCLCSEFRNSSMGQSDTNCKNDFVFLNDKSLHSSCFLLSQVEIISSYREHDSLRFYILY